MPDPRAADGVQPVSGDQFVLTSGDCRAVVASVGSSLRSLEVDGRALVVPYAADELRPMMRGATLAPWVNRVVGARYVLDGVERTLDITEHERGHAAHGLVHWAGFTPVEHTADRLVLTSVIEPRKAYPWRVRVTTTYAVDGRGLTQSVRGENVGLDTGAGGAPWGAGAHPYLRAGDGPIDDWTLSLPAGAVLAVSDDMTPTGLGPVDAADPERFDFRAARPLGGARIDNAFTALTGDDEGAVVELRHRDGRGVRLRLGPACGWVQVYTADRPGGSDDPTHRSGLAVEPMTCAPDAYNSGLGLVRLAPGQAHEASWRIETLA